MSEEKQESPKIEENVEGTERKGKSPEDELPPPPTPEQLQELDKTEAQKDGASEEIERPEIESKAETKSESEDNTNAEAPFEAKFEANFEATFDAKFEANFDDQPPSTEQSADSEDKNPPLAQTPIKSDQESDQEENTVHRKSTSESSTSTELGVVNDEPLTDEDTEQLKNDEKKEDKPKSDSEEEMDLK